MSEKVDRPEWEAQYLCKPVEIPLEDAEINSAYNKTIGGKKLYDKPMEVWREAVWWACQSLEADKGRVEDENKEAFLLRMALDLKIHGEHDTVREWLSARYGEYGANALRQQGKGVGE